MECFIDSLVASVCVQASVLSVLVCDVCAIFSAESKIKKKSRYGYVSKFKN